MFGIIYGFRYLYIIEGFSTNNETNKWSNDLIKRFLEFQATVNENNYQYNLDVVQRQASPEEVEYLLKNGSWPWSDDLKRQYIEKIWRSTMIKIDPKIALEQAMKTYNARAMTEMLAWNSKEGEFLLYGITNKDIIKCSGKTGQMEKIVLKGNNKEFVSLNPNELTNEIPGFSFVAKSCNPCVALDGDFSCPFRLATTDDKSLDISKPWLKLWQLN